MIAARQIAFGRGGRRLPYDAEVEWLESNGEQYVLTNYIPRSIDRIIARYVIYQTNSNGNSVFESRFGEWYAEPNYWVFLKAQIDGYLIWAFNPAQIISNSVDYGSVFECDLDMLNKRIAVYKEGSEPVYLSIKVGVEHKNQPPIKLFPNNQKNAARTRIMKFEAIRNGEKVADIIAVRKDGVGYMYDRVSDQLFGNAGTGAFILGPDAASVNGGGITADV